MPPFTGWYRGAEAIGRLIATQCPATGPGDLLLVPTQANGQPGFGMYLRDGDRYQAFSLQVVTLGQAGISHVASFFELDLFPVFGLPMTRPAGADRR
jgi:RNA polymerase sigma-70 factor, ECF subfamily